MRHINKLQHLSKLTICTTELYFYNDCKDNLQKECLSFKSLELIQLRDCRLCFSSQEKSHFRDTLLALFARVQKISLECCQVFLCDKELPLEFWATEMSDQPKFEFKDADCHLITPKYTGCYRMGPRLSNYWANKFKRW